MELYEVMIIINPELEKEEHEEVLNGLSATITKNKGKVDTILDWRKRRLAYEIDKKYQEGHYYLVYFSAQGTIIPEIEHYFKVTDGVIRYMIVRTDEQEFEAAAKKAADEAAAAEKAAAEESAAEESAAEESALKNYPKIRMKNRLKNRQQPKNRLKSQLKKRKKTNKKKSYRKPKIPEIRQEKINQLANNY